MLGFGDLWANIVAALIFSAAGYLVSQGMERARRYHHHKILSESRTQRDAVTVSLVRFLYDAGGAMRLQMRSLEEETIQDFVTNPLIDEAIKKAARRCTETSPIVTLDNLAYREIVMKKVLAALNTREEFLMRQFLDSGENDAECLATLIFEPKIRNPILRIIVFRIDDARAALAAYGAGKLTFERPYHENCIKTIGILVRYWDEHGQADRDDLPMRPFLLGYEPSHRPT